MRKRTESTRNQITMAAHTCFLRGGYGGASLDQIAKEAGVTKQTLYGYFPNKRALFLAVIEASVGASEMYDVINHEIGSAAELRAVLIDIALHISKVIANDDYIALLRITISESVFDPQLSRLFRSGVTAESVRISRLVFESATANGLLVDDDVDILARTFVGYFLTFIYLDGLLMRQHIPLPSPQQHAEYVDTFLAGRLG